MKDLLNRRDWLGMETRVRAKLKAGGKVEAKLYAIFEATSKRTLRFEVKVSVSENGEEYDMIEFQFPIFNNDEGHKDYQ